MISNGKVGGQTLPFFPLASIIQKQIYVMYIDQVYHSIDVGCSRSVECIPRHVPADCAHLIEPEQY